MKTIKQVCEESIVPAKLVRAVVKQLGGGKEAIETLGDVYRHGADAGFCGFTYYTDTVRFYKRNRVDIVALAETMADDLGENVIEMVMNFGCLQLDKKDVHIIAKALYGDIKDDRVIEVVNALAWFSLEEVARAFYD